MEGTKIKVYHLQGWEEYSNWIPNREIVNNIEDADLVFFEGGEDVSPFLYDENAHKTTRSNYDRDIYEIEVYKLAQALGKKCIGVCRGNQFLGVMNGSKLVQHQQNKHAIHPITTEEGLEILITSSHHQAVLPINLPKEDYKILAWTENISDFHLNGKNEEVDLVDNKEVEIIYFPNTACLCIQGHPEWLWKDKDYEKTFVYLHKLFFDFMQNKLYERTMENS